MTITVMTPEEYAQMPWYARQRALNRYLREQRMPLPSAIKRQQDVLAWAEDQRQRARDLLASMPADPDAAAHRAGLS